MRNDCAKGIILVTVHGSEQLRLKSMDVKKPVVILELKIAASYADMEYKSRQAVEQIQLKHYEEELLRDGYRNVLCYGIAFYKKNCRIALRKKLI